MVVAGVVALSWSFALTAPQVLAKYREKRLAEMKQAAVVKNRLANGLPEIGKSQVHFG